MSDEKTLPRTEPAEDDDRWEVLATLSSEEEAHLIQGRLESEGIPCALESIKFHVEPVNFGQMSEIRLHVLHSDLPRARQLLGELEEAHLPDVEEEEEDAGDPD